MRVLQLIDSLEAGGAERMAVNIANKLIGAIDGTYLCATRKEGLLKGSIHPQVGYLFLNKKGALDLKAIWKLYQFIKRERIMILHAHSSSFFMATLMKLARPSLKIVWHDHYGNSAYLQDRPYRILKFCSRFFSLIISVNSDLNDWAKSKLKCETVEYLPNFAAQEENGVSHTTLKGTKGKRILCLANLRSQKDHETLIKAFQSLHARYPDWTLHCVGQDFKDDYSESVYDLVSEFNLQESIFFYGSRPDTSAIIAQSTIGVLSSASEGLPLALLEYGLGRLPIVATNVGDCRRVFPKECHSFLVQPNNIAALSAQLKILMADEEMRFISGQLINAHVLKQFSASAVQNKLLGYYSQL